MTFAVRTLSLNIPFVYLTTNNSFNNSTAGTPGGATASAVVRLDSDGGLYVSNGALPLVLVSGQWLKIGVNSDYEAQGTWQSGTGTTSGPTGWVSLSTTRDWTLTATNNAVTRDILLEIRLVATSTVITSATITVDVDSAE